MPHHTTILFMTHYLSRPILEEFHALKKACSAGFDVKMLYDNSRKDFDRSVIDDASDYYLYDIDNVATKYKFLKGSTQTIVPGNCILPMLLFAGTNPDFRYVWRVEYDARFSGDWGLFFDYFASNESDLLGTTLFRYDFRPDWNWWSSLKAPGAIPETRSVLRGFFPVFRLSQKGTRLLEQAYQEGWRGHEEVTIPTILNLRGCSIEDIGGDGEFVKPENRNRFYTNTPASPGLAPGTFVYRPHQCNYPEKPNMLYHPVKQ